MFGKPWSREDIDAGRKRITWQYSKGMVMAGLTEQHVLVVTVRGDGKVESYEERNL
jgi:hypothetical protein